MAAVARRAGVCVATVSRAFTRPELVRLETRRAVEEAALALGYTRAPARDRRDGLFTGTVALVVPTVDNAIFAKLIAAFSARLLDFDRATLVAAHGYDPRLEVAILRSLLQRGLDGVALVGLDHAAPLFELVARAGVPTLALWNWRADAALPCLGIDNRDAGARVARHLVELGHRDVMLLFPPTKGNDRAADRKAGAIAVLVAAGRRPAPERHLSARYAPGDAKRTVAQALRAGPPPTAILCGNDVLAQGAVYACLSLGLRVPDEVSVIGIGDFAGSADMEPALTTLNLPSATIGRRGAEMLLRTGGPDPPAATRVEGELRVRGSTAPPRRGR